jgi:hypothetical protein
MSYQQSSNEQPYPQQQPPVMSPHGGGGSTDFQGILKAQGNRPLVIAGAGALLTLIGYLAFPIWGYSIKGLSESGISIPGSSGSYGLSDVGSLNAGGLYSLTWLVLIASIVALVVVGLMLFAPRAVAQLTPRLAAITLTVCGAICVLWTVLDFLKLNSFKGINSSGPGYSAGISWGMYALILTSIVLLVGGVMQLQRSPKVM